MQKYVRRAKEKFNPSWHSWSPPTLRSFCEKTISVKNSEAHEYELEPKGSEGSKLLWLNHTSTSLEV